MKQFRLFFQVPLAYLCLVAFTVTTTSCHYYKNRQFGKEKETPFDHFEEKAMLYVDSYYFVHIGDGMFLLDQVDFNREDNSISGQLTEVPEVLSRYYTQIADQKLSRYPKEDKRFIKQIHFFVDEARMPGDRLVISEANISEIKVLSPASFPTFITYAGVTSISLFLGFVIFLAIACGCPHVYLPELSQSESYDYTLFTGAIDRLLERKDYQKIGSLEGLANLRMQVQNEEEERQYIDYLALRKVTHTNEQEVFIGQDGITYLADKSTRIFPEPIFSNQQHILRDHQIGNDNLPYYFTEMDQDFSYLELVFRDHPQGLLALTVKNTRWSAYVYDQFIQLFGDRYADWSENVRKEEAESLRRWPREQGILMEVQLWTGEKWRSIEHINLVGDIASNTIAVPLSSDEPSMKIRLKSGFGFWEIGQVSLYTDFRVTTDYKEVPISEPTYPELMASDSIYLALDDDLQQIEIDFALDSLSDVSYFIHSEGFYVPDKVVKGKTSFVKLLKMRKPGSFSRYSKELYERVHK